MKFELLTLTGVKYRGDVAEVALRTASGQISVLPGHEPLTSIAVAGPVTVRPTTGATQYFAAFGGLLEVTENQVRLLADEAEPASEMIEAEVEAALVRAREMSERAQARHEVHQARELAGRHAVRLEVARMHRRHRSR